MVSASGVATSTLGLFAGASASRAGVPSGRRSSPVGVKAKLSDGQTRAGALALISRAASRSSMQLVAAPYAVHSSGRTIATSSAIRTARHGNRHRRAGGA